MKFLAIPGLLLLFLAPSLSRAQGSWNPPGADLSFPRILLDSTQAETIRNTLSDPAIYAIYQLVWDNANAAIPVGNITDGERFTRSSIAREAAFAAFMNRKPSSGSVVSLTALEREQLTGKSRQLLEEINSAVGFQSGWIFYQEWQHRSKELINYLIAYDLLRGDQLAADSLQLAREKLVEFTGHLYQRAMATYTVLIWQFKFFEFQFNNHSIMTASALGLAAVVLNDHESSDPDYQPQNWIDAGLWNLDNTLWREDGPYKRVSEPDTIAGYAEGPAYFEYGFENAFPFIRAFWNFLPDGTYPMTFNSVTRDIRNPWYDPSYANLYEWINLIRMPDGSSPAIHDSPIGFGTSITALSGDSRFNIPNPQHPPTDVMWRTQYIATNVAEGNFSDTLFRALPEAGSLLFRSSTEPDATYMHFIGKHGIALSGAKAHHQGDASSFSLMANGELLAVDPGYPGYQESFAVNTASNHSLVLVNGYGPLPPVGEAVSIATNTCWIEHFFDTPELDYGEVRTTYFGVDIVRKNLFLRDRYFILADFITSPNTNTYTFQLQGNGLIGGTPGTPEGSFQPDYSNHQGIYSRDSTHLLVHSVATGGASNYSSALDSLATGTSQYRHYSKMLVRKDSVTDTRFLTTLFPYAITEPEVVTLPSQPPSSSVRISDGPFKDLAFIQQDSLLLEIPATVSGLQNNIRGNGMINVISFQDNDFHSLFLEHGDSLLEGNQLWVKADHKMDVAYGHTSFLLYSGFVSEGGWVGFLTFNAAHFVPTSGNIITYTVDGLNSLVMVLFGGPSYFTLEYWTGTDELPVSGTDNNICVRTQGAGIYYLSFISETNFNGLLTLHHSSGKQVFSRSIHGIAGNNHYPMDLSGLASGLYIIRVDTGSQILTAKLIHY